MSAADLAQLREQVSDNRVEVARLSESVASLVGIRKDVREARDGMHKLTSKVNGILWIACTLLAVVITTVGGAVAKAWVP